MRKQIGDPDVIRGLTIQIVSELLSERPNFSRILALRLEALRRRGCGWVLWL